VSWEAKCLEQISLSATAFCRINDRSAAGPFARFGSTVSQASGEGERPVPMRADLSHCLSPFGLGGGSVRRMRSRLGKKNLAIVRR